jgi:hypothetical protein
MSTATIRCVLPAVVLEVAADGALSAPPSTRWILEPGATTVD